MIPAYMISTSTDDDTPRLPVPVVWLRIPVNLASRAGSSWPVLGAVLMLAIQGPCVKSVRELAFFSASHEDDQ